MVVGIDEAGRGCWAGPLFAAAVALIHPVPGLRDSKTLTAARRKSLADQIMMHAEYGVGSVAPEEIDELGLTAATSLAMRRAVEAADIGWSEVIIDGNYNYLSELKNTRSLIKADALIDEVSAASILAKVARDAFMKEQAAVFPKYGFDRHFGYGTKRHLAALLEYGPCEIHRLSYKPVQAAVRAKP